MHRSGAAQSGDGSQYTVAPGAAVDNVAHLTPAHIADDLRRDGGALWRLLNLLMDGATPALLHEVLRQVLDLLAADEVSLYAGASPPVLIAAHGQRTFAEQDDMIDHRLRDASRGAAIVALDPDADGWQVDPSTTVRTGVWVPAPTDAPTPAILRALRIRAQAFPAGTDALLTIVVKRLSAALWRLRQQQSEQARDAERAQLFLVSASVAQELDFTSVAQRVVEGVTNVTDFAAATVEVVRGSIVRREAAIGDPELKVGISSPLALWRDALADERAVGELSHRIPLRKSLPARGDDQAATATAGIVTQLRTSDGTVVGFLTLSRPRTGTEPSTQTVRTIELFARQAQIALVNAALYLDAKRQRDIARTLMRVTTAVSNSLDTAEILDTCCDAAMTHSVGERVSIFLIDEHGVVRHATARGRNGVAPAVGWDPRPLSDCVLLSAAANATAPLIIDDLSTSVRYATALVTRELGLRSAALYPLRTADATVGLLLVDSHSAAVTFGDHETALVSQIAAQAGVALRQSALHEQTREQAARNAQLLELTTAMTTTFEFEAIFHRIVEAVRARMPAHAVSVLRVGEHWMDVLGTMADDRLRCPRPPLRVPIGEELAGALRMVWRDGTLRADDVRGYPPLSQIAMPATRGVVLAAPVERTETNVLLTVSSTRRGAYTPADERFLADLAQVTRLAVRNADLFDEVADTARRDPLTGLLNRRVFWAALQTRLERLTGHATVAVAVVDADDFKQINDQLGHAVGDAALQRIADRLRRSVRRSDEVFRIGGEEFTVVMPDATAQDAYRVMQRALRSVREGDRDLPSLSVSIGIAVAPRDGQTADALFREADRALLLAKRGGKDRVVLRNERRLQGDRPGHGVARTSWWSPDDGHGAPK